APSRQVVDPDRRVVRLDGLLGDGEPEPEARAILPRLHEGIEDLVHLARGQAAALILDLDDHPALRLAGAQPDDAALLAELERVADEVADRRAQQPRVRLEGARDVHLELEALLPRLG